MIFFVLSEEREFIIALANLACNQDGVFNLDWRMLWCHILHLTNYSFEVVQIIITLLADKIWH